MELFPAPWDSATVKKPSGTIIIKEVLVETLAISMGIETATMAPLIRYKVGAIAINLTVVAITTNNNSS